MGTKYIFVTGGVVSGIGKGLTAASIGCILKSCGFSVTIQKCDPYINVDPGTINPCQHGEVFVTDDGAETDLDLGHYERFIDENLNIFSNVTSGRVFWSVISKERQGAYLGCTVQLVPHITDEIKESIFKVASERVLDFVITEIGGTVGDIESLPFLEAIRQISCDIGRENCIFIHVTLVPFMNKSGEQKSKPTQHSVKELLGLGIQPDMVICRTRTSLNKDVLDKIASFCNVKRGFVIENLDVETVYELPMLLESQEISRKLCESLRIQHSPPQLKEWGSMVSNIKGRTKKVKIALIGKYVSCKDAYLSVNEGLLHGGLKSGICVEILWINAEEISDENAKDMLSIVDGVLIPGGFGNRGMAGKIAAIKYARENAIPFLGICFGMQLAVIEFARNVLGLLGANSKELDDETEHPIIDLMDNQVDVKDKGGTMRRGRYPCTLKYGSKVLSVYGEANIIERHRHRYELNNKYRELLSENGLSIAGESPDGRIAEVVELIGHPWFIGAQYHPEFKSRPNRPHPLFVGFVEAAFSGKQT